MRLKPLFVANQGQISILSQVFSTPAWAITMRGTVAENIATQARKSAYFAVLAQVIVAGCIALAFFLLADSAGAKSAFKGGLAAAVPNFVFAFFAFRYSGAEQAERISAALMRGHSLKVLLTVILCAVVLQQEHLIPEAFITGFLITLLTQWTAPFFFKL
ncbi:MAG: F0F1 ATP synthase assembly protein I [Rheinheimera sp.]|nr:F0F1 ATP synthase assembly protein I [Rheinheimera sp.]|tara:strand:- start:241338 stop:241817 length:480 start_codon:yes stop_codon:yes gene_type:complete